MRSVLAAKQELRAAQRREAEACTVALAQSKALPGAAVIPDPTYIFLLPMSPIGPRDREAVTHGAAQRADAASVTVQHASRNSPARGDHERR